MEEERGLKAFPWIWIAAACVLYVVARCVHTAFFSLTVDNVSRARAVCLAVMLTGFFLVVLSKGRRKSVLFILGEIIAVVSIAVSVVFFW
jgi:hypothetical protein